MALDPNRYGPDTWYLVRVLRNAHTHLDVGEAVTLIRDLCSTSNTNPMIGPDHSLWHCVLALRDELVNVVIDAIGEVATKRLETAALNATALNGEEGFAVHEIVWCKIVSIFAADRYGDDDSRVRLLNEPWQIAVRGWLGVTPGELWKELYFPY